MKTIASFPQFDVVDLELEVINLTYDILQSDSGFRFCVSKETARHGNLYPEVSPGCCAYYARQYAEDEQAAIDRAVKHGHELHWINNCGSMLSGSSIPHYTMYILKDGQIVNMNGNRLQVKQISREHYKLIPAE